MSIRAENLSWSAGKKRIVNNVSLSVPTGQTLGLLGPNGSGKSSLLRILAGLRRPDAGRVLLDDGDIARLSRKKLAQRVDMFDRRDDGWQHLSGGERQRVHIARALAQSPGEILLDEPTNHLDIHHQMHLMRLISELPVTSIVALHDLNHAAMFCDALIVMQGGQVVASGTPDEVLTEAMLREVFKVEARIEVSPHHGKKHIHFV